MQNKTRPRPLLKRSRLIHLLHVRLFFFPLPLSPSPLFFSPFNLFPANPTHSSLIRAVAGSGVDNSAEIMGYGEKTKGWGRAAGLKMCWRATRKLACQSEKLFFFFFPMWNFFFFIYFGRNGLSYEAQAGSVCSGNGDFPEQHISETGKKHTKIWLQTAGPRGGQRRWQETIKSGRTER